MDTHRSDHEVAELLEQQRVTGEILRIIANSSGAGAFSPQ